MYINMLLVIKSVNNLLTNSVCIINTFSAWLTFTPGPRVYIRLWCLLFTKPGNLWLLSQTARDSPQLLDPRSGRNNFFGPINTCPWHWMCFIKCTGKFNSIYFWRKYV